MTSSLPRVLGLFLAVSPVARAATITSIANGDFSDDRIWDGGVAPGPGDDVVIRQNGSVTIDAAAPDSVQSLSGNHWTFTLQKDFAVTGTAALREVTFTDNGHDLTVGGLLSNSATLSCDNGNAELWNRSGGQLDLGGVCLQRGTGPGFLPGDVIRGDWSMTARGSSLPTASVTRGHADYDDSQGLSLEDAAAALDWDTNGSDRARLTLNWNTDDVDAEVDWTLRWAGDHVDTLRGMIADGFIVIGTEPDGETFNPATNVFMQDGYTYVAFRGSPMAMCQDTSVIDTSTVDDGAEPNGVAALHLSRSIWVRNDAGDDCDGLAVRDDAAGVVDPYQAPIAAQANLVCVRVDNVGRSSDDTRVSVFYAPPSTINLRGDWVLIGTDDLGRLGGGERATASVQWTPPEAGHFCLAAVVSDDGSAPESPTNILSGAWVGEVRGERGLCWRNTDVVAHTERVASAATFNLSGGDTEDEGEETEVDATLTFTDTMGVTAQGVQVEVALGEHFEGWQENGGGGSGFAVDEGRRAVRMTGPTMVLENVPVVQNGRRPIRVETTAAEPLAEPGERVPADIAIEQEIGGEVVGGYTLNLQLRGEDTDTDGDGVPDITDPDDDGDGVADGEDANAAGAEPCADADGDWICDDDDLCEGDDLLGDPDNDGVCGEAAEEPGDDTGEPGDDTGEPGDDTGGYKDDGFTILRCSSGTPSQGVGLLGLIVTALLLRPRRRG